MSDFYVPFAEGKSREEILKNYRPSTYQDYQKVAVLVRATDDIVSASDTLSNSVDQITASINNASESANKLSSRLLWLNILLAIITAVGVIFTLISAFKN